MRTVALAAALLLAACAIPPVGENPAGITVATADMVVDCTPLTRLTSTTGISGTALRDSAFRAARDRMARDALRAGADTIVFEVGGPGDTEALFVEGVAYRCQA